MKIALIDVDSHNYPNLALMKLSAWHKRQGDAVEWYDMFSHYDMVYMSKVFDSSPDFGYVVNADKVVRGGTGYAIHGAGGETYRKEDDAELPYEVEHIYPDYSLYGIKDTAYGFLTRGCPRGCQFCIVGKKEGLCSRKVADLTEFWGGAEKHRAQRPEHPCLPRVEGLAGAAGRLESVGGLQSRSRRKGADGGEVRGS